MTDLHNRIVVRHHNIRDRVASRYRSAYIRIGDTHENGTLRIHRYTDVIKLWDLTNAGKRGKRVDVLSISPTHKYTRDESMSFLHNLGTMLEDYDTFRQAVGGIKDFLIDFPDSLDLTESAERGVDVAPGGFKPVTIQGVNVLITVDYKDFRVRKLDDPNESTCIPAISGGVKTIPVFYRWISDNRHAVEKMTYAQILDKMRELGIQYHSYCAMD